MLKIEALSKTFNKNTPNQREIFKNLNFSVKPHEFVTIIGGNGAGKSTLMKLISGSDFPDNGKIYIDKKDITFIPEHKRSKLIGHVFQDPLKGTAPNMTVEENLILANLRNLKRSVFSGISKKNTDFLKEKILSLHLDLENRLETKVGLLSGGQRQAITLLMATLCTPKILLLDEHTAALDPSSTEKILDLTKEIVKKDKITTIMITHDLEMALNFGTRTVMFKDGEIILDVSGKERLNLSSKDLAQNFI